VSKALVWMVFRRLARASEQRALNAGKAGLSAEWIPPRCDGSNHIALALWRYSQRFHAEIVNYLVVQGNYLGALVVLSAVTRLVKHRRRRDRKDRVSSDAAMPEDRSKQDAMHAATSCGQSQSHSL